MGILEQVTQLKNQGISDEQIINILQEQGISPKQINDALSQAYIKNAVTDQRIGFEEHGVEGMEPSILQQEPPSGEPSYAPQPHEIQETAPMPGIYAPEPGAEYGAYTQGGYGGYTQEAYAQPQYYQEQEYYQPEAYSPYGPNTGGFDTNTMIEVAEQVFFEKTSPTIKQIEDINEFKTLAQTKLEHIETRLKKIEAIIDKLQISILEKIGSYGDNLESIKKEMSMMQDSFGKVIGASVEHAEKRIERQKAEKRATKKESKKSSKKK